MEINILFIKLNFIRFYFNYDDCAFNAIKTEMYF